jgi:hypothetical protein
MAVRSPDENDAAPRVGYAGLERRVDAPIFSGLGQFDIYILSLQEQAFGAPLQQRFGKTKQFRKRCKRAGGNYIGFSGEIPNEFFNPIMVDDGRYFGLARCLTQECRLLPVTLDQMDDGWVSWISGDRAGDHHAGKPPAGAEVHENPGIRHERDQLERISHVARP